MFQYNIDDVTSLVVFRNLDGTHRLRVETTEHKAVLRVPTAHDVAYDGTRLTFGVNHG